MPWRASCVALFLVVATVEHPTAQSPVRPAPAIVEKTPGLVPPVAARRPVRLTQHGIERIDDYAWLRDANWREAARDPERLDPDICAYLEAENAYAAAALAPLAGLRARLFEEMKGRLEPAESGVPVPDGPYAYWEKYVQGAEHVRIMRRPAGGGPEELLLDAAALAAGKHYFSLGSYQAQPRPPALRLPGR